MLFTDLSALVCKNALVTSLGGIVIASIVDGNRRSATKMRVMAGQYYRRRRAEVCCSTGTFVINTRFTDEEPSTSCYTCYILRVFFYVCSFAPCCADPCRVKYSF